MADPLATVVRPAPLSTYAVTELLRANLAAVAEDAFGAACHEITGGNPLLLHELVNALVAEGVDPVETGVSALRELTARAGWRAVSVRLGRLPPAATRLAQAVAILGDDVDPHDAAKLAELSDEEASAAAADLARVDVLRPNAPLEFAHPLLRGAVYETLTALERSSGHTRAAHLLLDRGADPERVAAHLLPVPPAPFFGEGSTKGMAILREAARSARLRGASESAAAYLRRAYAEPVSGPDRAELLLDLGMAEALVSGSTSVEHLREAHRLLKDPIQRAKTALMLGRQLFFLRPDESVAVLTQALDEIAGVEPELERVLEAGLITNALFWPKIYEEARRRLDHVRAQFSNGTVAEKMLLALLAFHDARANMPSAEAVTLARRALKNEACCRGDPSGPYILASIVLATADEDDALSGFEAAVTDAHGRGSILAFAAAKAHRAETFLFRGDLHEAEAEARDAFVACDTWGMSAAFPGLLASFLGESLMEQGRLEEAAAVMSRGGAREASEILRADVFLDRRARLRMLRGDLPGGLEQLLEAGRRFEAVGGRNPAFMPWRSQAALALLQLDRPEEAAALAQEELELARVSGGAAGAGGGAAGGRTGRGRRRGDAAPAGGGRAAGRLAGQARAGQGAHRAGGGPAPGQSAHEGARAAAPGGRAGHHLWGNPACRPGRERAAGDRGTAAPDRAQRGRVAYPERAAGGRAGGRGADQPRDRPDPVRHPEDGRGTPLERLPQARDQLTLAAGGGAGRACARRLMRPETVGPGAAEKPLALRIDPLLERDGELAALDALLGGELDRGRLLAIERHRGSGRPR